jgi:argininosuccinate lyase
MPESAATGSSMMPQKLNPDVAGLRGRRVTAPGRLTGLLAVAGAIAVLQPRSPQEDKVPVFAARRDDGDCRGAGRPVRELNPRTHG